MFQVDMADTNKADKKGWTPVHNTAYHGCTNVVQLLLVRGADPNKARGNWGWAALHRAARNRKGHKYEVQPVQLLIEVQILIRQIQLEKHSSFSSRRR